MMLHDPVSKVNDADMVCSYPPFKEDTLPFGISYIADCGETGLIFFPKKMLSGCLT